MASFFLSSVKLLYFFHRQLLITVTDSACSATYQQSVGGKHNCVPGSDTIYLYYHKWIAVFCRNMLKWMWLGCCQVMYAGCKECGHWNLWEGERKCNLVWASRNCGQVMSGRIRKLCCRRDMQVAWACSLSLNKIKKEKGEHQPDLHIDAKVKQNVWSTQCNRMLQYSIICVLCGLMGKSLSFSPGLSSFPMPMSRSVCHTALFCHLIGLLFLIFLLDFNVSLFYLYCQTIIHILFCIDKF
jgi:hypothetical protein